MKRLLSVLLLVFAFSYVGYGADVTLDMFEYSTSDSAQSEYVSNGGTVNSPISQWKMNDDAATKVVIDSVGSNPGTSIQNTEDINVIGKINGALSFNGSSDYIAGFDAGLLDSYSESSVCLWFKSAVTSGAELNLLHYYKDTGDALRIWIDPDRVGHNLNTYIEHNNDKEELYFNLTIDTDWHHIVVTMGSVNNHKIYLDGVEVASDDADTIGLSDMDSGATLNIGRNIYDGTPAYWFNGAMDDIRIYNSILTLAEIKAIYYGGYGIEVENPQKDLQCSSEPTKKQQGSYSLKGIAVITDSLNETLTRTVSPTIDLSGKDKWIFYIYSSRTGSNIKVGIHDSGGTTTESTPNVTSAGAWQKVEVDISGVANANKDDIDSIIITPVNADAANTFYLDNIFGQAVASGGGNMELYTSYYQIGLDSATIKAMILSNAKPDTVYLTRTSTGTTLTEATLSDSDVYNDTYYSWNYTADVSGEASDTAIRCEIVQDDTTTHFYGISLLGLE